LPQYLRLVFGISYLLLPKVVESTMIMQSDDGWGWLCQSSGDKQEGINFAVRR
jgi:hypothetical protein